VSTSIVELPVLAGVGAVAMGACLVLTLWKRAPAASFGVFWLFTTLMPVLNARWMSAYVLAERYLYLPSVGFCLVAGWACMTLWQGLSRRQGILQTAAVAVAFTIIALCISRISWRVLDWQNDITLYTKSLKTNPDDYRLHDALGLAYWARGDAARAEPEWQETLRLEPNSAQTLTMLGALYARQRRFDLAVPLLERALQLNPEDTGAHMSLGALCAETGKPDRAVEQFRAAVQLSPMNFTAHNLLGKLYLDSNRLAEAEQQFRQSLGCEPNLAAYDHLGFIYMRQGDRNRAEEAFKQALAMNSADSHAHFNLGLIYAATGRAAEAETELNAALAADPGNPEILSALKKLHP
jgi:Flp pilus assembly protein TadD